MSSPLPPGLVGALNSGQYSDIHISCLKTQWKAHRVVVCSQSSVLRDLVQKFEADRGDAFPKLRFESQDDELFILKMMEYFYRGDYNNGDADEGLDFSLRIHARSHRIAVMFDIPGLEQLAVTKFTTILHDCPDLEVYFRSIIDVYSLKLAKFGDTADLAAEHRGLRQVLTDIAVSELPKMLREPLVKARFHQITCEVPDFQFDVMQRLLDNAEAEVSLALDNSTPTLCTDCATPFDDVVECKVCGKMWDMMVLVDQTNMGEEDG